MDFYSGESDIILFKYIFIPTWDEGLNNKMTC